MRLNWIQFRNRKIGAFTTPQFIDQEPEIAAMQLSRALQMDDKGEHDKIYEPLVMYFCGTYDDETGSLVPLDEPKELLICSKVINQRKELFNGKQGSCD